MAFLNVLRICSFLDFSFLDVFCASIRVDTFIKVCIRLTYSLVAIICFESSGWTYILYLSSIASLSFRDFLFGTAFDFFIVLGSSPMSFSSLLSMKLLFLTRGWNDSSSSVSNSPLNFTGLSFC